MGYSAYNDIPAQHRWEDVHELQKLISERVRPDYVVELGTASGAVTWAFCDAAKTYGGKVFSFDFDQEPTVQRVIDANPEHFRFIQGDLLFTEKRILVDLIKKQEKKVLLYCDNGFKEWEMLVYGKYLKVGDILGCHDYVTEVDVETADNIATALGLERFEWGFWEGMAQPPSYPVGMCRFWVKKHPTSPELIETLTERLKSAPEWEVLTQKKETR